MFSDSDHAGARSLHATPSNSWATAPKRHLAQLLPVWRHRAARRQLRDSPVRELADHHGAADSRAGVRLDRHHGRRTRAWDLDLAFDISFSELGRSFHLTLSNGFLVFLERDPDGSAPLHLTLIKPRLIALLTGDASSDGLDINGDFAVLESLIGVSTGETPTSTSSSLSQPAGVGGIRTPCGRLVPAPRSCGIRSSKPGAKRGTNGGPYSRSIAMAYRLSSTFVKVTRTPRIVGTPRNPRDEILTVRTMARSADRRQGGASRARCAHPQRPSVGRGATCFGAATGEAARARANFSLCANAPRGLTRARRARTGRR